LGVRAGRLTNAKKKWGTRIELVKKIARKRTTWVRGTGNVPYNREREKKLEKTLISSFWDGKKTVRKRKNEKVNENGPG